MDKVTTIYGLSLWLIYTARPGQNRDGDAKHAVFGSKIMIFSQFLNSSKWPRNAISS